MERYFKGKWQNKPGSHMVVTDERLVGKFGYGQKGEFSIPVKKGQQVKGRYVRALVEAIRLIELIEAEKGELS